MSTVSEHWWRILLALVAIVLLYYFDYKAISLGMGIAIIVIVGLDYLLKKKEDPE